MTIHWEDYKDFSKWEFDCAHTQKNKMRPEFMAKQQEIRNIFGKVLNVTSGYRDFTHPQERMKKDPGEHYYGCAADYNVWGEDALFLINTAYHAGIRRIGLNQTGDIKTRFVHIGMGDILGLGFPPGLWTY